MTEMKRSQVPISIWSFPFSLRTPIPTYTYMLISIYKHGVQSVRLQAIFVGAVEVNAILIFSQES